MKKIIQTIAALCCITSISCTTILEESDIISSGNEVENKEEKDISLHFQLMKNDYTRAGNEDEISSLRLSFYSFNNNERKYLYSKDAKAVKDNSSIDFSASINTLTGVPNIVIAFANLPETIESDDILNSHLTIADLTTNDGQFVMSSARYYDKDNSNADIYYSVISDDNLKGTPIFVYLDRVATKVTVSNAEGNQQTIKAYDIEDNSRTLQLELTAWDIIGSDLTSYIIKENGNKSYSDMNNELSTPAWDWNNSTNHTFNWAHSVNWDKKSNEFPIIGKESPEDFTRNISFSQINNNLGESNYYHETTRDASLFTTPNARPSVVLAGQYKIMNDDNVSDNPVTLYRNGNYILTQNELIKYFGDLNRNETLLFCKNNNTGVAYNEELINNVLNMPNGQPLSIGCPKDPKSDITPNLVTLQIVPEHANEILICNNMGKGYTQQELEALNGLLIERFGLWEVFDNGKCFFTIPIEHTGKTTDPNGIRTGSYGMVRNHHYVIKINNIEGFGHGVNDENSIIGEWPFLVSNNNVDEISYIMQVNKWNDVEQEVNIPKN